MALLTTTVIGVIIDDYRKGEFWGFVHKAGGNFPLSKRNSRWPWLDYLR